MTKEKNKVDNQNDPFFDGLFEKSDPAPDSAWEELFTDSERADQFPWPVNHAQFNAAQGVVSSVLAKFNADSTCPKEEALHAFAYMVFNAMMLVSEIQE